MYHKIFLFIYFLGMSAVGQSQQISMVLFPQGFLIPATHSAGFASISRVPVEDIGAANPAAITRVEKPSFGMGWMFRSRINNAVYGENSLSQEKVILPEKISFIYGFKQLALGLSYTQNYNSRLEFKVPISLVNGDQSYGNFNQKARIQSVNAVVGFKQESKQKNRFWGIGTTFHVRNVRYHEEFSVEEPVEGDADLNAFAFSVGFLAGINEFFSIGVSYEKGINAEGDYKVINPEILVTDSSSVHFIERNMLSIQAKTPDRLNFGMDFFTGERLQLSTTISYVKWRAIQDNSLNSVDFSQNFIVKFPHKIRASLGFIKTDKRIRSDFPIEINYRTIFITAGYEQNVWGSQVRFLLLDSHLLSDKGNKTTLLRLAWGITFHK